MAVAAAPAVASAAGAAGTGAAAGGAAAGSSGAAAATGGRAAAAGRARASSSGASKGGGGGKGGGGKADLLEAAGGGGGKKKDSSPGKGRRAKDWGKASLSGDKGRYRRILVAEFIVCVLLLGLSPLAKKAGEMSAVRFMKRGSSTCAFFIILGLISSLGKGAGKAAAMFGGLVTLVLLVDQREAFGRMAALLNAPDDEGPDQSSVGPPTDEDTGPDLVEA